MVGKTYMHMISGDQGVCDEVSVQPDGTVLLRINDHWYFEGDCTATE